MAAMRGLLLRFRHAGVHPSLIVAMALMLLWVAGHRRLSGLSDELIQLSRPGIAALARYLAGDHAGAARLYRAGQRNGEVYDYTDDRTGAYALLAGDLFLAEQRARATLALVPTAVGPRVTLAEVDIEGGRFNAAWVELAGVLERRPDHDDALYLGAVAAARLGRPGEAIDFLNRALAHGNMGSRGTIPFRVMELAGDLAARPAGQQPLCLLAHLYRYLRVFDRAMAGTARAYAERAVAAGDRPADAWLTLAVLADKAGDHAGALREALRAIERDGRHTEALRWASTEAQYQDVRLEYWLARRAFDLTPADQRYVRRLEQAMRDRGAENAFLALMKDTVARDPGNVEARLRLLAWHHWRGQEDETAADAAALEALLRHPSGDVP
jgi:tetratricopeptide (TPR) repeat protein